MCMVRSPKSIGGAVGLALGNAPYGLRDQISVLLRRAFGIAPNLTASINVQGAFPKIYWWSSRTCIRERTLQDRRSHLSTSPWLAVGKT